MDIQQIKKYGIFSEPLISVRRLLNFMEEFELKCFEKLTLIFQWLKVSRLFLHITNPLVQNSPRLYDCVSEFKQNNISSTTYSFRNALIMAIDNRLLY